MPTTNPWLSLVVAFIVGGLLGGVAMQMLATPPVSNRRPIEVTLAPGGNARVASNSKADNVAEGAPRRLEEVESDNATLKKTLAVLRGDVGRLQAELTRTKNELAKRDAELLALKDSGKTPTAEPDHDLAVRFGKWNDIKELRTANWAEFGQAYTGLMPLMKELMDNIKASKQDPSLMERIQKFNGPLANLAIKVAQKVPTYGINANGAFSHPVVLANILAAQLQEAGVPLREDQLKQITEFGNAYELAMETAAKNYTDKTLALTKLLDEVEAKQIFMDRVVHVLDPAQRVVMGDESLRGTMVDLYSPGLMLQGLAWPVAAETREDLRESIVATVANQWGIERLKLDTVPYVFDDWLREVEPNLAPVPRMDAYSVTIPAALVGGRAQAKAVEEVLRTLQLDAAGVKKLRSSSGFLVPRLIQKK